MEGIRRDIPLNAGGSFSSWPFLAGIISCYETRTTLTLCVDASAPVEAEV